MQKLFMIQSALNRLVEVKAVNPNNDPNWVYCNWLIGDPEKNYLEITIGDEGFEYHLVSEGDEEKGTIESVTHLKELIGGLKLNIVFKRKRTIAGSSFFFGSHLGKI